MDTPTKTLIVGLLVGGLIAGAGVANSHRLQRKIQNLRANCVAEGQRDANRPDFPRSWEPICDPMELGRGGQSLVGVQQELANAQRALWLSERLTPIAVGIGGVLALPWAWYFVLRRVRELRDAVVGK